MPSNDKTRVIVQAYDGLIVDHGQKFARYESTLIKDNAVWTRYTPELWKELRLPDDPKE